MPKYGNWASHNQIFCPYKKAPYSPAKINNARTKKMLPLFGRSTRKSETIDHLTDDWCVPTEQELRGAGRIIVDDNLSETLKLETVCEVPNESLSSFDETKMMFNEIDTFEGQQGNDEFGESEIIMVDCEDFNLGTQGACGVNITTEIEDLNIGADDYATSAVLKRIEELEKKLWKLNSKVTQMEHDSVIGKEKSDSNASRFVNEVVELMQQVMKNGISYQQRFMGKFIDELDTFFDIDISNFDPFK